MNSPNDLLNAMNEILAPQKQQVMALMSCIHISNISSELKQDDVREKFLPFGTIDSIHMACDPITHRHGGSAFIEYDFPEAAEVAMEQMNGVLLGGKNIRVVSLRVANEDQNGVLNMPQTKVMIDEIIQVAKTRNRIYVASLNPLLAEEDVKFIFEKFGRIKSCELPSEANRRKGYGFIEFETKEAADDALSMNSTLYAGRNLRVCRAITPPNTSLNLLSADVSSRNEVDIARQTKSAIRAFNEYVDFFA